MDSPNSIEVPQPLRGGGQKSFLYTFISSTCTKPVLWEHVCQVLLQYDLSNRDNVQQPLSQYKCFQDHNTCNLGAVGTQLFVFCLACTNCTCVRVVLAWRLILLRPISAARSRIRYNRIICECLVLFWHPNFKCAFTTVQTNQNSFSWHSFCLLTLIIYK